MESSADIVQEAFKLGAQAYVLKSQAGGELLAAVEAVIQGNQFVSSALADHVLAHIAPAQAPDHFCDKDVLPSLAPPLPRESEITRYHAVQFYSDDESFLDGLTRFIIAALKAQNAVIVVATKSHRTSLLQSLHAGGVDTAAAVEQKRYIPLDVADALATFMVDGLPDPVRFAKVAGNLIMEAGKAANGEHRRVAACGECAPTLWAQGNADAAIQLEHLWDEIARTHDVDILCGYVLGNLDREQESDTYERICAEHSAVYCAE